MRSIRTGDGTPIQQSMTIDVDDYRGTMQLNRLMIGVVIDVFPSDSEEGNRSSWQSEDRVGFQHECSVLVLNDGGSTYMVLPHVVIPPFRPSGMDNYAEQLPRASTGLTTGEALASGLAQIDPYDLDGDMCVVGFIGGLIDQPFIISWWPHPRNTFDTATSGAGYPNQNGEGRALVQAGRYFSRVNGVETTVTPLGDIVISTTLAGSTLNPGGDPENGRYARRTVDGGGSVRIYMKESSTFEWVWDEQIDGVGPVGTSEPSLPQTNPRPQQSNNSDSGEPVSTYACMDKNSVALTIPSSFSVKADNINLEGSDQIILKSDVIKIGENAEEPLVLGSTLEDVLTNAVVQTAMGPANFDQATIARFVEFQSTKHVVE